MKIVAMSDTHGRLLQKVEACDVVIMAGDIIGLNDQRDPVKSSYWWKNRFIKWVKNLKCDKVIITPGNHDFFMETLYKEGWADFKEEMTKLSEGKLVILINEYYNHKGFNFYGSPYIKPIGFQEGRWAFESSKDDDYEIKDKENVDILITHDNPLKNLRIEIPGNILLGICGHWHNGLDCKVRNVYNCSILDDWYNEVKKPRIFNISKDENHEEDTTGRAKDTLLQG